MHAPTHNMTTYESVFNLLMLIRIETELRNSWVMRLKVKGSSSLLVNSYVDDPLPQ